MTYIVYSARLTFLKVDTRSDIDSSRTSLEPTVEDVLMAHRFRADEWFSYLELTMTGFTARGGRCILPGHDVVAIVNLKDLASLNQVQILPVLVHTNAE